MVCGDKRQAAQYINLLARLQVGRCHVLLTLHTRLMATECPMQSHVGQNEGHVGQCEQKQTRSLVILINIFKLDFTQDMYKCTSSTLTNNLIKKNVLLNITLLSYPCFHQDGTPSAILLSKSHAVFFILPLHIAKYLFLKGSRNCILTYGITERRIHASEYGNIFSSTAKTFQ